MSEDLPSSETPLSDPIEPDMMLPLHDLGLLEEERKPPVYHEFREDPKSLWLISFTDLIGVMLAFFVLMYSMSSPREDKWNEVTSSLERGIGDTGPYRGSEWNSGSEETIALQQMDYGKALDMSYLVTVLNDTVKNDKRLEKVTLRKERNQIVLVLPDDIISAGQISESGELVLAAATDLLRRLTNRVEIVAHMDAAGARANRVNGWEAALARAARIGGALQGEGYDRSVSFYAMKMDNADSAVETAIIITSDDGSQTQSLQLENDSEP